MSVEVKRRRGSSSEIAIATPALGEIVVNTDDYSLVVGDGVTVGGRAALGGVEVTTGSVADLKTKKLKSGDAAATLGYYESNGIGAASYVIKTAAAATADGDILDGYGNHLLATAGGDTWAILIAGPVIDASAYGVSPTLADIYLPLQAVANTTRAFTVGEGEFITSAAVQVASGQVVSGANGTNANGGVDKTLITNSNVGGGVFWYTLDTSIIDVRMPTIKDISLVADYPIRFNDEQTAVIADGAASNVPYGKRPKVINCDITRRAEGVGIGVSWSKMFDGVIEGCEINGFDIDVLLNGCDLNRVEHNRIIFGHSYHILELSVLTFSSQNEIRHNDILKGGSTDCIFVKSTARHTRIYDNYLEHTVNLGVASVKGFIDISEVAAPSFASNTVGGRFTAVARDNRIDGMNYATEFVYRYQPERQTYGEIIDVGTTGPSLDAGVSSALLIVDAAGAETNTVPYLFNQLNESSFIFRSPKFKTWNGYSTDFQYDLNITSRNLGMFGGSLFGNNASDFIKSGPESIIFLDGFTGTFAFEYPAEEKLFALDSSYTLEVEARVLSGTESLSFAGRVSGAGDLLQVVPLTTEFKKFQVRLISGSLVTDTNGAYFQRTNNGNVIEIKSITFTKRYLAEERTRVATSLVFTVPYTVGRIQSYASGNFAEVATRNYEFVNSVLIETAAQITNAAQIDITTVQAGNVITFTVTGAAAAGDKRITALQLANDGGG